MTSEMYEEETLTMDRSFDRLRAGAYTERHGRMKKSYKRSYLPSSLKQKLSGEQILQEEHLRINPYRQTFGIGAALLKGSDVVLDTNILIPNFYYYAQTRSGRRLKRVGVRNLLLNLATQNFAVGKKTQEELIRRAHVSIERFIDSLREYSQTGRVYYDENVREELRAGMMNLRRQMGMKANREDGRIYEELKFLRTTQKGLQGILREAENDGRILSGGEESPFMLLLKSLWAYEEIGLADMSILSTAYDKAYINDGKEVVLLTKDRKMFTASETLNKKISRLLKTKSGLFSRLSTQQIETLNRMKIDTWWLSIAGKIISTQKNGNLNNWLARVSLGQEEPQTV